MANYVNREDLLQYLTRLDNSRVDLDELTSRSVWFLPKKFRVKKDIVLLDDNNFECAASKIYGYIDSCSNERLITVPDKIVDILRRHLVPALIALSENEMVETVWDCDTSEECIEIDEEYIPLREVIEYLEAEV